jgi:predicted nucleotidyltransferase
MPEWDYDSLVEAVRADGRVVGLILTGSRGRGPYARPDSDWDVRLIVRDEALAEAEPLYGAERGEAVETVVLSLSRLRQTAEIGAPDEWDRYSYAHCQVVIDKLDGRIDQIVAAKGVLPSEAARDIAGRTLDNYINSYYRSARNLSNGLAFEAHLDAAESVSPFLTTLFALYERVRPYNKFLRWELEEHPLGDPVWNAAALLPRLETVTSSGDLGTQQGLFRDMERVARARGHDEIVDGWEPHVSWLRGEQAAC